MTIRTWAPAMAGMVLGGLLAAVPAGASSHREALTVLNEPCADNTDTYAWVSNGSHDKLYLIMDFNPLHEPGQGNQGLRACNGYRYEFHIGKGTSLRDRVVYRVEFQNRLKPEAAPSPADPLGGGNELLWQLTGGTETMKVTRIVGLDRRRRGATSWVATSLSSRTTTARRPTGSSTASAPSRATTPGMPRAGKWVSTTSLSSTTTSTPWRTAGGSSPASSTTPTSSMKRGSSTWST